MTHRFAALRQESLAKSAPRRRGEDDAHPEHGSVGEAALRSTTNLGRARATRVVLVVGVTILFSVTRGVAAQEGSRDSARADELFLQGRALMRDGRQAEACPKFAESQRLDPSVGTEINLAVCLEETGKTGSAWRAYRHAQVEARRVGQAERADAIADRLAVLERRLSRLRVDLADVPAPFLVRIDGAVVERGDASVGVPVDPGGHVVSVEEGQSEVFRERVQVSEDARLVTVRASLATDVPLSRPTSVTRVSKQKQEVARSTEDAESGRRERSSAVPWRTVGAATAGVGVLVGGVAAGFALVAHGKYRDALATCGNRPECSSASGLSERREADSMGLAATGCMLGAATLILSGGIIYFAAPAEERIGFAILPTPTGFSTGFRAKF
ncbi:MAG: hypothetical protein QM784_39100 [Polyangiaceae bacterium]